MTLTRAMTFAALCAATSVPLAAHHSGAMFDDGKVVEVNGTIKEVQWTNPHIWIQVIAERNGQKTEWSIEGGSPGGSVIGAKFKDTGKTLRSWG